MKKKRLVRWSKKEIKLLLKLYPILRVKDLIEKFPQRNKNTIVAKALSLGLPSAKIWQPEENLIIKNCFKNSPKEELLKLLPKRTWVSIIAQGERMGLKRKTQKPRLGLDEEYFQKWSYNMSYILGFILADGCITEGTYKGYSDSLKFGVQLQDIDILKKIKKEFVSAHKISIGKNVARFSISSQKLVSDLKKLGIIYRKSLNEKIPDVPQIFIKDFIRGVIDGDGSIQNKQYPVLSVCGGKNTMTFIRNHFFNKFELYSVLTKFSYSKKAKKYLYSITYKSNSAKTLLNYLYTNANLYLDRKYRIAEKCIDTNIKIRKNHKYIIKRYNETFNS